MNSHVYVYGCCLKKWKSATGEIRANTVHQFYDDEEVVVRFFVVVDTYSDTAWQLNKCLSGILTLLPMCFVFLYLMSLSKKIILLMFVKISVSWVNSFWLTCVFGIIINFVSMS